MLNQLVRATEVHGSGGIGDIEIREPEKKLEKEHGADFLIRTFMENDDISLITLGPLTNVAQAILKEPELKKRIPEILCMGGSATSGNATPAAEFNILVDPEAAKIVFESGIPIKMAGLNLYASEPYGHGRCGAVKGHRRHGGRLCRRYPGVFCEKF